MFLPSLLVFLSYLVLGGVSFLIWWKAKAPAALLMLVGFGLCWVVHTFNWWGIFGWEQANLSMWLQTIGISVAATGFVLTFWTKIQADVEKFRELAKEKISHAASKGTGE